MDVVSVQRWWKVVVDDSDRGAGVVSVFVVILVVLVVCLLIVVFPVSSGDAVRAARSSTLLRWFPHPL